MKGFFEKRFSTPETFLTFYKNEIRKPNSGGTLPINKMNNQEKEKIMKKVPNTHCYVNKTVRVPFDQFLRNDTNSHKQRINILLLNNLQKWMYDHNVLHRTKWKESTSTSLPSIESMFTISRQKISLLDCTDKVYTLTYHKSLHNEMSVLLILSLLNDKPYIVERILNSGYSSMMIRKSLSIYSYYLVLSHSYSHIDYSHIDNSHLSTHLSTASNNSTNSSIFNTHLSTNSNTHSNSSTNNSTAKTFLNTMSYKNTQLYGLFNNILLSFNGTINTNRIEYDYMTVEQYITLCKYIRRDGVLSGLKQHMGEKNNT
ncbi:putative Ankyrin repeat-containing domain, Ankyrin repeat protein, partial [Pseudoloma neurophilia]